MVFALDGLQRHNGEYEQIDACLAYRFSIRTAWRPPDLVGSTRRHQPAGAVLGAARSGPQAIGSGADQVRQRF